LTVLAQVFFSLNPGSIFVFNHFTMMVVRPVKDQLNCLVQIPESWDLSLNHEVRINSFVVIFYNFTCYSSLALSF